MTNGAYYSHESESNAFRFKVRSEVKYLDGSSSYRGPHAHGFP